VTFVGHMFKRSKKFKSNQKALKHNEMKVLIYNILNFIILGFRFPLKGNSGVLRGEVGKLKALPDKGICISLKRILVQHYQNIISFIFQKILRGYL
jgi:hypothetical protein